MTWLFWIVEAISVVTAAMCLLMAWRLHRLTTQYRVLDHLLFAVVYAAFLNRHLPIWMAWKRYSGMGFAIDLVREERDE